MENRAEQNGIMMSPIEDVLRLRRWLVSIASGLCWYAVGEFVALDGHAAIDRAIEVFGSASDYRADKSPGTRPRCRGRYLGRRSISRR